MPIIILSPEDRDTILSLLRREVDTLNDDGGICKRLEELVEKAPNEHTIRIIVRGGVVSHVEKLPTGFHYEVQDRYEELLFAQRAGKLTPAQEEELALLESDLSAAMPARTKYEQDLAFFANLLRKKWMEETKRCT